MGEGRVVVDRISTGWQGSGSGYRWLIFGTLTLGLALVLFHQSAPAVISSHLAQEWALEAASLGLLGSVWFLPYALLQIPGGYLADLWGPRRVITSSLTMMSVGTLLFASATTYSVGLGGRFVVGVGCALIFVPSLKAFAAWFGPREFATVQGLFILTANLLGGVSATTPLALTSSQLGWRTPMLAIAVFSIAAAALTWLVAKDRPQDLRLSENNEPDLAIMSKSDYVTRDSPLGSFILPEAARFVSKQPSLWISWLILFISFGSFLGVQGLWAGPWLRDAQGLTSIQIGGWLLLLVVGLAFGTFAFGYVSDRIVGRRRPLIILGLSLQAFLWGILILFMPRLPHGLGQLLFFLIGSAMGGTILIQVVIKELCPYRLFGTVFGFMNTAAFLGSAAVQVLTGWILKQIGPVSIASDSVAYSANAYSVALSPIGVAVVVASALCWFLPETLTE